MKGNTKELHANLKGECRFTSDYRDEVRVFDSPWVLDQILSLPIVGKKPPKTLRLSSGGGSVITQSTTSTS